ncbi:MAG: COG4315 family predicted lipoprotein [Actinomycetota bacterium]
MQRGIRGLAVLVGLALVLTACASNENAADAGAGGGTNTAKAGGQMSARSIPGIGAVLQAPSGLTLYRLTTEKDGKIACTGDCAATWPPLLVASGKVPSASPDVADHLGTVERPDGSVQVTFKGMPLYTYAGDSGPGQANGQGLGGVWFVVTASGGIPGASSGGYPGY